MILMSDLNKVSQLKHLESCRVNWAEESGGVVFRIYDDYIIYEVSGYGCSTNFDSVLSNPIDVVKRCYEFT